MTRTPPDAAMPVPAHVAFTEIEPCAICVAYARSRGDRIRSEIRRTTPPDQRLAKWWRFMAGVHDRHLNQARRAMTRVAHTPKETR